LEFLARSIRQEEEIKGIQIGREMVKLSLLTDDMILYLKDPKTSIHPQTPIQHKKLQHVVGNKINIQKSMAFLHTNNEQIKKEYENNSIYNNHKKIKHL
jgi:hypothetical protein